MKYIDNIRHFQYFCKNEIFNNKRYMTSKIKKLNEEKISSIVDNVIKKQLLESEFRNTYDRTRDYHSQNNKKFGFELRKDGKWQYGDIEYDLNTNTLSCMGITINVDLTQSFRENLEDLFEELCNNGFDTDF